MFNNGGHPKVSAYYNTHIVTKMNSNNIQHTFTSDQRQILSEVCSEQKVWQKKNFGVERLGWLLLGVAEESGELAHAILKEHQNIRDHVKALEDVKDSAADMVIFLMGAANEAGVDFTLVTADTSLRPHTGSVEDKKLSAMADLVSHVGRLSLAHRIDNEDLHPLTPASVVENQGLKIMAALSDIAELYGFDLTECVKDVWVDIVSKRDWVANPDTGSSHEATTKTGRAAKSSKKAAKSSKKGDS